MKIKEISVQYSATINLGNYNSFRGQSGVVVSTEPGEDPEEAFKEAWKLAEKQVKQQLEKFKKK